MSISTITPNVPNLLSAISIGYSLIGIFLVCFTRVRTQLMADTRARKDPNGVPPPTYKIFLLRAILTGLAIVLWPFFLSLWFDRRRKLYDIVSKNLLPDDVQLPTTEEMNERAAQYENENKFVKIPDEEFPYPKSFEFAIGGYHGTAHQIKLVDCGELEYKFAADAYQWYLPDVLMPEKHHWEEFWRDMDAIQFWQWQPEYQSHCCDGTHWSICVQVADKLKRTTGSNAYPGSDNSRYQKGGQFDLFLKAVQKLTGKNDIR